MESDRNIHKIKSESGVLHTLHEDINTEFKVFYEKLYSSQSGAVPGIMQSFLGSCKLPELDQEDRNYLEAEITCEDIIESIKSLKNGKSPGPDGLSNEIYKQFREVLAPYLLKVYNRAMEDGALPPTMNEAIITLIPKKGRDPEKVGSYRPISLLNTDQKILTKILARRLSIHMGKMVHPDQTGFIPKRNLFYNLRRLFNIIHSFKDPKEDLVVLSLDAEKAFDQVEWSYLFALMEKFKMGDKFIAWIKLLYSNPSARILTNQMLSSQFALGRGCKQG